LKAAKSMYKLLYYVGAVICGYYLMKDEDYMPKSLLGSGDFRNSFKDYPYQRHNPAII